MDKVKSSDSYVALLDGTMATVLITVLFYLVQFKKDGNLVLPHWKSFFTLCAKHANKDDVDEVPVPIVIVREAVEAFLAGCAKVFPALIVLTLASAIDAVSGDVGARRLFSRWIKDGLFTKSLPTLSSSNSNTLSIEKEF